MDFDLCSNCLKYQPVFDFFEMLHINEIPGTVEASESSSEVCPKCISPLKDKDYVIPNTHMFLEEVGQKIGELLSEGTIAECQHCNTDIIYVSQKHGDPLSLTLVYDLVEEWNFPIDLKEIVAENIYCPNCSEKLEEDQPYVTLQEILDWYGQDIEILIETFGITETEGQAFIYFLLNYPMLGLSHDIGQKIFSQIKDKNIPGTTTLKTETSLFRGRKRSNLERLAVYLPEELWNPPMGIPGQGRFNPPGVSSLYLAGDLKTVSNELDLSDQEESMDIAEFQILNDLLIWDSTKTDTDIFNSIPSFNKRNILKEEYIFPNFIAQCLMASGYKGIIYKSTKGEGLNYCLFNFNKDSDLTIYQVLSFEDIKTQLNPEKHLPF